MFPRKHFSNKALCLLQADSFHLPGKHFTQPFRRYGVEASRKGDEIEVSNSSPLYPEGDIAPRLFTIDSIHQFDFDIGLIQHTWLPST